MRRAETPGPPRRGDQARYSATLFVATPMRSLTVASRVGGSVDRSSTTAPIAAGPGFPRAAVAVDDELGP